MLIYIYKHDIRRKSACCFFVVKRRKNYNVMVSRQNIRIRLLLFDVNFFLFCFWETNFVVSTIFSELSDIKNMFLFLFLYGWNAVGWESHFRNYRYFVSQYPVSTLDWLPNFPHKAWVDPGEGSFICQVNRRERESNHNRWRWYFLKFSLVLSANMYILIALFYGKIK